MSREAHRWNESQAADFAWSLFAGLTAPEERYAMVIQGIFDESESSQGNFVIGGYLATAPSVAKIAKDWDPLRRKFGFLDDDGTYQFKYSQIARPERRENLLPFYRVIEANIIGAVAIVFNKEDLLRAILSLSQPLNLQMTAYRFAVRELLGVFNTRRSEFAGKNLAGAKVKFIFDDNSEKGSVYAGWDAFVQSEPSEHRLKFGAAPDFESDKEFLPLQAADFLAGYVRECADKGVVPNFAEWQQHREFKLVWFSATEDDFRAMFSDPQVRSLAPLSRPTKTF